MSYRENLYTFITVYRHGSQQKAAQELHLTQPAVSQHIKILEQYLGKRLFDKKGRSLEPTPIAHQLALEVRDTFSQLDNALQHFRANTIVPSGIVCLGGIGEFFAKILVPTLKPLNKHNIQLRFEIDHATLLKRLLSGEIDLAHFVRHIVHPNVVVEKIFHQEIVLVGHPDYKQAISTRALASNDVRGILDLPWIAYDESLLFVSEYFQTVFNQVFTSTIKLLVKDLWSILEAVSAGIGITVLPTYFCRDYIKQKKVAILYHPKKAPSHDFYLGWKHGALHDPKIRIVRDMLLK